MKIFFGGPFVYRNRGFRAPVHRGRRATIRASDLRLVLDPPNAIPAQFSNSKGGAPAAPREARLAGAISPGILLGMPGNDSPSVLRTVRLGLLLVLATGVAWRLVRYALGMPLWGDEAAVGLNLLDRSFAGLLAPLDYAQVGPVVFLWLEKAALLLLGTSEYALRLLPVMAGIGGLLLFHQLARVALAPLAAGLATAILAVSYYPVRHCVELKPYSFDLLASVALLLPAALFCRDKTTLPLAAWMAVAPLAVFVSFPAVFVFGASAAGLLFAMREASQSQRALWLIGSLLGVSAFVWMASSVANPQFSALESPMTTYWSQSFPPASFWKFPLWLLQTHAANMSAYPVGGKHWGSSGTLLLCALGLLVSSKKWPPTVLALFLLPFLLTLAAAFMHRYPYGGSARIAQHLAPTICILAGAGAAWLIELQPDVKLRRLGVAFAFALLAVVGLVGIARDIGFPYKSPGDMRARQLVREWAVPSGKDEKFAVWEPCRDLSWSFQWFLRTCGVEIVWDAREDRSWATASGPVNVLSFDRNVNLARLVAEVLPDHRVTTHPAEDVLVGPPEKGPDHWQRIHCEAAGSEH